MVIPLGQNFGTWVAHGSQAISGNIISSARTKFLAEYYPTLKGAAEFCIGWLIEKDGKLITSPSTSPENNYVTPDGYAGAILWRSG